MANKPHGGKLINRLTDKLPDCSLVLDISTQNALDLARIADGSYSPLTGFMNSDEPYVVDSWSDMQLLSPTSSP